MDINNILRVDKPDFTIPSMETTGLKAANTNDAGTEIDAIKPESISTSC